MLKIHPIDNLYCHTEEIIQRALNSYRQDAKAVSVFVVPESSKASIERIVNEKGIELNSKTEAKKNKKNSVCACLANTDVLSFMRLAVRITDFYGETNSNLGDETILRSAIYSILAKHGKEFKTFGKLVGRFEYIDMLIDLLGDFSRYGIDASKLADALEKTTRSEDAIYYAKLFDLKLMFDYLEKLNLQYGLYLTQSPIDRACSILNGLKKETDINATTSKRLLGFLKSASFTILGFGSTRYLTPKEIEFIELLVYFSSSVTIYPLCSTKPDKQDETVFHFGLDALKTLTKNVDDVVVEAEAASSLKQTESFISGELEAYKESLDAIKKTPMKLDKTENVFAISVKGIDDRLALIANEIIRLTRYEGYRYRDIRIVCADQSLMPRLQSIMELYGLDMFIDRKAVLYNTPILRYSSILLTLPVEHFSTKSLLRLLRTGILPVRSSLIDEFENYCYAKNLMHENRVFNEDFYAGEELGERLWDSVVFKALVPAREIAIQIANAKTIKAKAECLAEHISSKKNNIELLRDELLERKDAENASALVRGYDSLMKLLISFTDSFNEIEITQEMFSALIRINMRNKTAGTIPLKVDSVEITTLAQSYMTNCKALFMVGATEENFPFSSTNDGLMTQKELTKLSDELSISLPNKALTRHKEGFIASCLMLGAVTERLYLIHEKNEPNDIVFDSFSKSAGVVMSDCFTAPIYGESVKRRYDYKTSAIDPEVIKQLCSKGINMSVTKLQTYNECPLRYMVSYVLKINERANATDVSVANVGTLMHSMYEVSIQDIVSKNATTEMLSQFMQTISDESLNTMAQDYYNQVVEASEIPCSKDAEYQIYPGEKIRRMFKTTLPQIIESCVQTGFVPIAYEYNIEEHANSPITMSSESGISFSFRGSIDRVDKNDSDELKIMDYKTGAKIVKLEQAYEGEQIQLFAYAKFLSEIESKPVVDVAYINTALNPSADINKPKSFDPLYSKLSTEDVNTVMDYSKLQIKKTIEKISVGKSEALVSKNLKAHCQYCNYSSACGNGGENPECMKKTRFVGTKAEKDTAILEKMKLELGGKDNA